MSSVGWLAAVVATALLAPLPAAHAAGAPRCDGRLATIVGTAGDDHIVGTPRADVILALDGRDLVEGMGGDDRICGGADSDVLHGGGGADRLFGEANRMHSDRGGTWVFGDVLDGGAGDDLLDVGDATSSDYSLVAERVEFRTAPGAVVVDLAAGTATGQGHDVVRYVPNMSVRTGEGDDTILGTKWGETVDGGPGNDTVTLFRGADSFVERRTSLPDDDVVDTGKGPDRVAVVSGADRISTGSAHDDVVLRGRGPYSLDTGRASDWVFARATDRPGASYDLGAGSQDYLSLELGVLAGPGEPRPIRVTVPSSRYEITTSAGVIGTAIRGIERFVFFEGWALDFLGGEAAESLEIQGSAPLHAVMGGGDDRVWGTRGDDYIDGGDGTDFAYAGRGDDTCVQIEESSGC